jgi:hypothetical protein
LAYGRVDTASALERCVAALNIHTKARPCGDLGDLADTPTAEEYEYLEAPAGAAKSCPLSAFPAITIRAS